MKRGVFLVLMAALAAACATQARSATTSSFELMTTTGTGWPMQENVGRSNFTVIEFFSTDCPVQKSHDARLVELYRRFGPRGVAFVAVDSEVSASPEHDESERRARGYPFPILIDKNARFADSVHADYSTYTLIVDREGAIRYEGGIDSDRATLTDSATPYLSNALDDLLSGGTPRVAVGKVFGCMLRKW